jgi:hypothetical protein
MPVTTLKHGKVYIELASGASSVLELRPGAGNLSISGLRANQTEEIPVMDRNEFLELVEGAQTFPTWTLTLIHDGSLTSTTNRTAFDSMLKTGAAASESSMDAGGQVHTGKIYWIGSRSGAASRIDLPNNTFVVDYGEAAEGNTISASGTSYGRPTFSP